MATARLQARAHRLWRRLGRRRVSRDGEASAHRATTRSRRLRSARSAPPRSGPGEVTNRSIRLPTPPPSNSPSAIAVLRERTANSSAAITITAASDSNETSTGWPRQRDYSGDRWNGKLHRNQRKIEAVLRSRLHRSAQERQLRFQRPGEVRGAGVHLLRFGRRDLQLTAGMVRRRRHGRRRLPRHSSGRRRPGGSQEAVLSRQAFAREAASIRRQRRVHPRTRQRLASCSGDTREPSNCLAATKQASGPMVHSVSQIVRSRSGSTSATTSSGDPLPRTTGHLGPVLNASKASAHDRLQHRHRCPGRVSQ